MSIQLRTSIPGPRSQALMKRRNDAVVRAAYHATPVFVAKAEGAVIEDVDGNRLLDFAGGIGCLNTGHRAPGVVEAVRRQLDHFLHTSFNVLPYESYIAVCEKLNALTPGNFRKKTLLVNTGAEATENAIKIVRSYTKRPAVVSFEDAFHGRTYMAMAMTSKTQAHTATAADSSKLGGLGPASWVRRDCDQNSGQIKGFAAANKGILKIMSKMGIATLEALVTHFIDDLDSRLNSWVGLMGREGGNRRWTDSQNIYGHHIWRGTLPTAQVEKKGPPPELWRRWYSVNLKRNHGMSRTTPAITDKYIVTMGPKCHVMCCNPQNGDLLWGIDLGKDFNTEVPLWYTGQCPLIDNDIAVIAPGGSSLLIGVDCATGKVVWKTPNPDK